MKILVGYDGSKVAEDAVKLAQQHGHAFKAEVYIMTSLEQSPTLKKEDIDRAESKLESLQRGFKVDDIPCEIQALERIWSIMQKTTILMKSLSVLEEDQRLENWCLVPPPSMLSWKHPARLWRSNKGAKRNSSG
jgi:nucleotide-binding universal stress UspA family protein